MQTAIHFLQVNKEVAFATSEGNRPKIRLFQIMRIEGTTLFFATSPQKEVYRQLQENPHVEVLATQGCISVRCSGVVRFDVDDERQQWIYHNNPVLPRLYSSYDKLAYFALDIAQMDYYDLNPTPPVLKHFDLQTGEVDNGFVGERFS